MSPLAIPPVIDSTPQITLCFTQTAGFSFLAAQAFFGPTVSVWDGVNGLIASNSIVQVNSAIIGNGNSGVGVRAENNATVILRGGTTRTTITGTGGALRTGGSGLASIAYGAGAGAWEEVAGYNGNFTRKNEGTAAAPISDASRITNSLAN